MALFTLTIPDDKVADILAAFSYMYGYQTVIAVTDPATGVETQIPNPETRVRFAKRHLAKYVLDILRGYKIQIAKDAAAAAASVDADLTEIKY